MQKSFYQNLGNHIQQHIKKIIQHAQVEFIPECKDYSIHQNQSGWSFKMTEEEDVEIAFLPTNTSEIHLHVEQLLQNTYLTRAEDFRPPKMQETSPIPA